jgi:MFS family permease
MYGAINATVFAHYFGRRHLGEIKGFVTTITVAGTALGPLIFSFGKDLFGNYAPILALTALFPLVLALLAPWLRPPNASETHGDLVSV